MENVPKWGEQCEITAANVATTVGPSSTGVTPENSQQDINSLESTIHHHQSLYESMCQVLEMFLSLQAPFSLFISASNQNIVEES